MSSRRRTLSLIGGALSSLLLLALPASSAGAKKAPLPVVAAENFWGNIASQIGGSHVSVTSLITNPNADPHLFETDAADAAKLAQAKVVIENGASYDTWMHSLLGADSDHPALITAANVLHISGSDPNPHLWYDIPAVPKVAAALAAAFSKADPADAATFHSNVAHFDASLQPLLSTLATIRHQFPGAPVAYTERVPGYLLAAAHLTVKTPVGFARSVEDGVDPGPADTIAMQRLLTGHRIDVLLYNVQTVTSVTAQIRALALHNGVAVVGVSETMPASARTYQQWQGRQLTALLHALEQAHTGT
ncbi:MAG TPA: zinc ABC transporter substrate-binding protein [Acidimicrobiales bacterium]|jgi:zinc/manganese transport system substrate-binding protein|nr:zinc ABC transporter substrate-binding protein [Acidimicrobiales bacterium]